MKYLYIWNDIPNFKNIDSYLVEKEMKTFLDNLKSIDKCKYIFIEDLQYRKWIDKLGVLDCENVITIGTRPSMINLGSNCNSITIKLKREIGEGGETTNIKFLESSQQIFIEWLQKYNEINLVEDIVVGGKTLEFLCDFINDMDYPGRIVFNAFCVNKIAIDNIITRCKFEFVPKIEKMMEKKPIEESTLLCLYDLLYNKLGDEYYRERTDLMSLFFFDEVDKLLAVLDKIDKNINV